MKYLITGGCGFLGSNLANEVMRRGEDLVVFDNLSRAGSALNLDWLKTKGALTFHHGDIRNKNDVNTVIQKTMPDVIFHLAGQVAMTTSLENPLKDFEINVCGSINVLDAVKSICPNATIIYSSTNKVYGDLDQFTYTELDQRYQTDGFPNGFDEHVQLDFRSPYGCSKGAADQYMLDYSRNFDLNTIVFRHSSIFGGRQFSTFDQGWVGWFIQQALERKQKGEVKPFTISGTGKQVRDVLFASDLIDCYFGAAQHLDKCRGQAFNIGGGMSNSLSLLELFSFLETELDITLEFEQLPWRSNDQKVFVADIAKANKSFDWAPKVDKNQGLRSMIQWVESNFAKQ
jgi:CDP-paratose 2-epimerase